MTGCWSQWSAVSLWQLAQQRLKPDSLAGLCICLACLADWLGVSGYCIDLVMSSPALLHTPISLSLSLSGRCPRATWLSIAHATAQLNCHVRLQETAVRFSLAHFDCQAVWLSISLHDRDMRAVLIFCLSVYVKNRMHCGDKTEPTISNSWCSFVSCGLVQFSSTA